MKRKNGVSGHSVIYNEYLEIPIKIRRVNLEMAKEITLTDLMDIEMLQKIQDAFAHATGMAALTVDLNGAVTRLSNPTDFCMNLTRGSKKGAERCNQCDLKGGEEAARTGRPSVYFCHGGLMDFAAPILLEGRQIGSLIGGQVLPVPPDEAKFRRIAKEIGVDEEAYIRALSKIKIVPKKNIEASADLLFIIANALSDMGYQKYMTQTLKNELLSVSAGMLERVDVAMHGITSIEHENGALLHNMEELFDSTKQSKEEVEKTNQIAKYINDVSMQTKLLGFNASVEASRSREYGAGFAVIAQEIRRLADSSQEQFNKIGDVLQLIKNTIHVIDDKIIKTNEIVDENAKALSHFTQVIHEIDEYAHRLDKIGRKL